MKIENKDLERIEVSEAEVKALLDRLQSILSTEDYGLLEKLVKSFVYATRLLEDQGMTIARFRKLLFGAKSEKLADVFDDVEKNEQPEELSSKDDKNDSPAAGTDGTAPPDAGKKQQEKEGSKQKAKGHGRNGAEAYKGAEQVYIEHQSLKPGDPCPVPNCTGKLYELDPPRVFVWVTGRSPVGAEVFTLQALRCNLCLTVFTANLPEGVGPEKYDATAASVMAILRYGNGLPLNRLERLQAGFKIPLPAATQWDVVEAAYRKIAPAYDELEREAAQGDVLYNDDTTMKVLEIIKENKERKKAREKGDDG